MAGFHIVQVDDGTGTAGLPELETTQPAADRHSHDSTPKWVYKGYSNKAPMYHLWQCDRLRCNVTKMVMCTKDIIEMCAVCNGN